MIIIHLNKQKATITSSSVWDKRRRRKWNSAETEKKPYKLSSFKYTISKLDCISLSCQPSAIFLPFWGHRLGHHGLTQHNLLKKVNYFYSIPCHDLMINMYSFKALYDDDMIIQPRSFMEVSKEKMISFHFMLTLWYLYRLNKFIKICFSSWSLADNDETEH